MSKGKGFICFASYATLHLAEIRRHVQVCCIHYLFNANEFVIAFVRPLGPAMKPHHIHFSLAPEVLPKSISFFGGIEVFIQIIKGYQGIGVVAVHIHPNINVC